jgi:hypothetical protein
MSFYFKNIEIKIDIKNIKIKYFKAFIVFNSKNERKSI